MSPVIDMVKGAIEVAQRTRVSGWIYAEGVALKGKTVLAFVAGRCVGSGNVDRFRKDLLEAGLGDGYCGYDFPVKLLGDEQVGSLIVKVEESDLALIQSTSVVAGTEKSADLGGGPDLGAIRPESVSWMMDRGMLEQPEYDFLKAMQSAGAYERGLRSAKRGDSATAEGSKLDPEATAQEMLSLFALSEIRVSRANTAAISELIGNLADLRKADVPVVALWSRDRGRVVVEERSHLEGRVAGGPVGEPQAGSIEYSFGPDRLLFVHRDCRFAAKGTAPASGVVVFTSAPCEGNVKGRRPDVLRERAA